MLTLQLETLMPNSHRPPDTTRRSCLRRVWRCGVNWTIALNVLMQTSDFLSATVFSCRESNSQRRRGRDTDKTVLSCLAWRCELAVTRGSCLRRWFGRGDRSPGGKCPVMLPMVTPTDTAVIAVIGFDFTQPTIITGWLDSRVVSVLDSGAEGPGFKSQLRRCRVTVLGKLFTPIVPLFAKQRNW